MKKIKLLALLALFAICVPLAGENTIFPLGNLVTLDDKPFDPAIVRGKYIILNLWTTWCPYCAKEKKSIQQFYEKYEGDDFTILTISLGETVRTVKEYMSANDYSFPVLVDTANALRATYAPRIPATYLVDPDGYIIAEIKENIFKEE
jgi:thiol-disulfide isomerase/thioredoxin